VDVRAERVSEGLNGAERRGVKRSGAARG